MKTNEDWSEIVDTLRPYLNGNPAKEKLLKDVENCLRFLGWKKTNGTMRSRSTSDGESGKTAITLLKREGDSGWQAFPVMTESPDGMTYATGLYIRENIRLYYRPDSGTGIPVCVLTAELREDDTNGPLLCALLSYKEFDLQSVENFCLRRYNLIRTVAVSASGWRIFFPEVPERRISPACSGKNSCPKGSRTPLSGRNWRNSDLGYAMKKGMP